MGLYKIAVMWQETGVLDIEALTLFDAIKKAGQLNEPLTFNGKYLELSLEVDKKTTLSLNPVSNKEVEGLLKGLRKRQSTIIGNAEVKKWKLNHNGGIFIIRDLKTWSMQNVHGIASAVNIISQINK